MKEKKEDRRVRITKQAIKESLIELMQKCPISKISVKMLCETADINRSTFYAHYADQYDLLRKIQEEIILSIKEYVFDKRFTERSEITIPVLIQILEYAKANTALFKVLLSENGDFSFQDELMFLAQEKTIEEIREDQRLDDRTAKYLEIFAISGFMSIIRKWLEDGAFDEPEKLAELITNLLFQGVSSYY